MFWTKLTKLRIKVNWRVLLVLLAFLFVVNAATGAIAETVELSSWTGALLLTVARISYTAFHTLLLVTVVYLVFQGVKLLARLFPDLFSFEMSDDTDQTETTEADDVTDAMEALGERLADIETNRDEAIRKLQDADVLASTLVGLIQRTVAKAKNLARECELMETALSALTSGDPMRIAQAAGRLNDDHIRNLMLETNGDDGYHTSLVHLIATQTGALRSSSEALRGLSVTWIESLTRYRAQTARLAVVIDALDAARPIASIDASLRVAQTFLMMYGRGDLQQVTRNLPTGQVGPLIEGYR